VNLEALRPPFGPSDEIDGRSDRGCLGRLSTQRMGAREIRIGPVRQLRIMEGNQAGGMGRFMLRYAVFLPRAIFVAVPILVEAHAFSSKRFRPRGDPRFPWAASAAWAGPAG